MKKLRRHCAGAVPEPRIALSFTRPLTLEMREEMGEISLKDAQFNIGLIIAIESNEDDDFEDDE